MVPCCLEVRSICNWLLFLCFLVVSFKFFIILNYLNYQLKSLSGYNCMCWCQNKKIMIRQCRCDTSRNSNHSLIKICVHYKCKHCN